MPESYLIGLDYGSESARGVLIDADSGALCGSRVHAYTHGVITRHPATGAPLPRDWALQDAADYVEAAGEILAALGRGRTIESIGIAFTASSPLPATASGQALSALHPDDPHAYVKLWKHRAAQPYADAINRRGGSFLDNFGGRVSAEWLPPKAAQIATEAPATWGACERFIEAGDWLVWQLTGVEARSPDFAAYKAQYTQATGYPAGMVPGLVERLAAPVAIGSAAGGLTAQWRRRTGIDGPAAVAVAVIDSHGMLPAVGGVAPGTLAGALGTSAGYLYLNDAFRPLPPGLEGVARDAAIPGLWCYEAGQAGFGDTLDWFVRTFAAGRPAAEAFRHFNREAADLQPGEGHLLALDWWSGNRVPFADGGLSGLLLGLTTQTRPVDIYRSLLEALCFGARAVVDCLETGDLPIHRILVSSGLARNNPLLVQIMADVLKRTVEVPEIEHATAVGAAIHGAVANGKAADYAEGTRRFGARNHTTYRPHDDHLDAYDALYADYRALGKSDAVRSAMHALNRLPR